MTAFICVLFDTFDKFRVERHQIYRPRLRPRHGIGAADRESAESRHHRREHPWQRHEDDGGVAERIEASELS